MRHDLRSRWPSQPPNFLHQFLPGTVFHQTTIGPGSQRPTQVTGMHRQDQYLDLGHPLFDGAYGFYSVHLRHLNIHQDDSGLKVFSLGYCLQPVRRLSHDFNVGECLEDTPNTVPGDGAIIDYEHCDLLHGGSFFRSNPSGFSRFGHSCISGSAGFSLIPAAKGPRDHSEPGRRCSPGTTSRHEQHP